MTLLPDGAEKTPDRRQSSESVLGAKTDVPSENSDFKDWREAPQPGSCAHAVAQEPDGVPSRFGLGTPTLSPASHQLTPVTEKQAAAVAEGHSFKVAA